VNHIPNYLLLTLQRSNAIELTGGNPINNNCNSSGNIGHRIHPGNVTASTLAEDLPKLKPGDLILLREDNTTTIHWPIAVIKETHPGKDGIVRIVTVRIPKGDFERPIVKICLLPRVIREQVCHSLWGSMYIT